ncbi:maleylpyruvate isomerase N-terminal domain-containing protein [Cellulomonas aerilata]|uniref:Mycothiol-dependent maleylpyruvate isomerase metal-binding domain-containing protein n=1 Tax=Cellulomonas aerilata TaxID=515326 RepID=A0A512DGG4_9CELL|nr:maleylpyruvate isomerase N-terminal domain-containing protein [Cellulomonas aerilata]GEO35280.1 hypothetical protein CAE01nite_30050 [Cellulomonas aerilata]
MPRATDALDAAFPAAALIALDLIRRPEVAERWSTPSALPHLSVGALACHLGRQAVRAAEGLAVPADGPARQPGDQPAPPPVELPVLASADEHYHRAAWVTAGPPAGPSEDDPDEADAARGPADLQARTARATQTVRELLTQGARDVVPIPWQGWALRRGDFLLTRQLEVVVHCDDLAVSVGVPTPTFPEEVFGPVRDLLVRLAEHRHGQSAVIGALTRSERGRDISAF